MIAPSGKQITIATKDQQAVVVEVGGGLRSYSVDGHKLLDGYDADEMSSSGRGQVLSWKMGAMSSTGVANSSR